MNSLKTTLKLTEVILIKRLSNSNHLAQFGIDFQLKPTYCDPFSSMIQKPTFFKKCRNLYNLFYLFIEAIFFIVYSLGSQKAKQGSEFDLQDHQWSLEVKNCFPELQLNDNTQKCNFFLFTHMTMRGDTDYVFFIRSSRSLEVTTG